MNQDISRFPVPELNSLPDDVRIQIEKVAQKTGFVPNVFLVLAHRPAEFRAFFAYYDALMIAEGPLSKAEREMIVIATSAINKCQYCIISHGALLRIFSKETLIADQIAINYQKSDLPPNQKAMLDFACKVADNSAEICDQDYQTLENHGYSQQAAWDIGAIAAFFALSNRMASMTDMRPNDDFYTMAR